MKLKYKYVYIFILLISYPYELTFTYLVNNYNFLTFISRGKNYDFEPFPLNLIADLQYNFLYQNSNYTSLLYFLPLFFLWLNNSLIKEVKHKTVGSLNNFITSYFPYFIMNFVFYRLFFYYCKFSETIETTSICEQTDNYFYFSIVFIFIFFVFFKPIYKEQSSNFLFAFAILLLFSNLFGSGFILNYPSTYVQYQDLVNFDTALIFLILVLIFKSLNKYYLLVRVVILLLTTTLYFKSLIPGIVIVITFFTSKESQTIFLKIFEFLFALYLLISISFSSLTYGGYWDSLDLINEFYSFALTPSVFEYFPQYNYLLPLLVKPIILQFSDVIHQFNLLMGTITFFSLALVLKIFHTISKNNFFYYMILFFGFGFNFYTSYDKTSPTNTDLINGDIISLLIYFQSFPLKIYMYTIFSFFFLKYLKNKQNNVIKFFLYFLLLFSLLDNPFVGFCLSASFLGYEFISSYEFSKFKAYLSSYWFLILFNILFLFFIFFNEEFKHMYLFINSTGFTDSWYLHFHYSGFHIFSLFINLLVFIFSIQKINTQLSNEEQFKIGFLIYNSIFILLYFVYFIGRSHPSNLEILLIPLIVSFVIFFELIKNDRKLNLVKFVLVFIFASSVLQFKYIPNIFNYFDNIYTNEINLEYMDQEINGVRAENIQLDPYLDKNILNKIGHNRAIILSRYGSILSYLNSINGYSPLISNVVFSDHQCTKLIEFIDKPKNNFILISKDSYVLQSYSHYCFREKVTPLLENSNLFNLSYEDKFYKLYEKTHH